MKTSPSGNGSLRTWRPYPAYKNSGAEWLGHIPVHWTAKRLKFCLYKMEQGWSPSCENRIAEDHEWAVLKVGCVNGPEFDPNENKALPPDLEPLPELEIRPGDVLMSRANTRELLGSCSVVRSVRHRLLLCDKLYRLHRRPSEIEGEFLVHALASRIARYQMEREATGASGSMQNIAQGTVWNLVLPVPACDEQCSIVAFLNNETAKIDALIAKKERLIELLQEKRTALISHAVTKGLDPSVPMEDSGVEWLGKIPESWNLVRNKVLFREVDERSTNGDEELLTVSHITGVTRRSEKPDVTMFLAETLEGYKRCEAGDVVVNTMWAFMGALGTAFVPGVVSPSYNVYRLRDKHRLDPRYLDLLYRIPLYKGQVLRYSKGIWHSRLRLYPEAFFEIKTIVPSLSEQKRIVENVGKIVEEENRKITLLQQSIEKLREYRTALISAAVTGKIDVRKEVD